MRALFVGGCLDASEIDLDGADPQLRYPENTQIGRPSYILHHLAKLPNGKLAYALYAPTTMAAIDVAQIASKRRYAQCYGVSEHDIRYHCCLDGAHSTCPAVQYCTNFSLKQPAYCPTGEAAAPLFSSLKPLQDYHSFFIPYS